MADASTINVRVSFAWWLWPYVFLVLLGDSLCIRPSPSTLRAVIGRAVKVRAVD